MIPSPPLADDGSLAITGHTVHAELYPGLLAPCCVCRRTTLWHWCDGSSYHPLHNTPHCIDHLLAEWTAMITAGEVRPAMAIAPTGAYARRAQADGARAIRTASQSAGSPFFRPGMLAGTPWTAVATLTDGRTLITPCGANEQYAYRINVRYRALAERGWPCTPDGVLATEGRVVDPTGAIVAPWVA